MIITTLLQNAAISPLHYECFSISRFPSSVFEKDSVKIDFTIFSVKIIMIFLLSFHIIFSVLALLDIFFALHLASQKLTGLMLLDPSKRCVLIVVQLLLLFPFDTCHCQPR